MLQFIDCETVPRVRTFDLLSERMKELFQKKFRTKISSYMEKADPSVSEQDVALKTFCNKVYEEEAGLSSEFNQIICVSFGTIVVKDNDAKLYIRSVTSRNETELLKNAAPIFLKSTKLVAHNGKEFDFPLLMRHYILNGLPIPPVLNSIGKKTWETDLDDTQVYWGGTAFNYRVSLDMLAELFGIPSSKTDMDGSKVAGVYYSMFDEAEKDELPFEREEKVLNRIAAYCNSDVVTLANIYQRMKGLTLITESQIVYLNEKQK